MEILRQGPRPLENAIVMSLAAILLFTMASETLIQPNIIPSEDYLNASAYVAYPLSILAALIALRAVIANASAPETSAVTERTRNVIGLLMFIPASAVSVLVFVQSSLPQLAVWLSGTGMTVDVKIAALNPNKDRKYCTMGVIVADRPFFADEICDIGGDMLQLLRAGDDIQVTGTGNWMGVIPAAVTLAR